MVAGDMIKDRYTGQMKGFAFVTMNAQEKSILQRAKDSLLTEWTYSLGLLLYQAQQAMANLLRA